ncbi:arylsulfatase [Phytoactinopolyspora endophytica]|uniref:arylsulfatase n=1 Tax=Phytoactinopolyspora endophytica TaxID=1642495 RepID=UPI00101BD714|nr:arylsulfatase [Phytoactinopolyspora endophytica]
MTRQEQRPNVVLILADDLGYSDIRCYGGEIDTPNLDRLAAGGLRMSQFYNTARCSPSRASLLTGLHPHQTGIGILVEDQRPHGYQGFLNDRCVTVAEVLRSHGYGTYMSGKWHLTGNTDRLDGAWPTERGFDRFYGTLAGAGSYYNPATLTRDTTPISESQLPGDWFYTDAISDQAASFVDDHIAKRARDPFFLYVAYTAPHWPLHAPSDDIEAYAGRYDHGWDQLRARRMQRLFGEGLLDEATELSQRDPDVAPWDETPHQQWEARRMQTYAAQVTRMDLGIGRIIDALESQGQLDNTMLIFLSDNGGSAEGQPLGYVDEALDPRPTVNRLTRHGERVYRGNTPDVVPGPESTWASYGRGWSNLSNTPFRRHKSWVHEGGIATPFIVHWPHGLHEAGTIRHAAHQLPDVIATILDATDVDYPRDYLGRDVLPPEGTSMLHTWDNMRGTPKSEHTLCWEHLGHAAVRQGRWKLVRAHPDDWELYDLNTDRTELHDQALDHPQIVTQLATAYQTWAKRCSVIPREQILKHAGAPQEITVELAGDERA